MNDAVTTVRLPPFNLGAHKAAEVCIRHFYPTYSISDLALSNTSTRNWFVDNYNNNNILLRYVLYIFSVKDSRKSHFKLLVLT